MTTSINRIHILFGSGFSHKSVTWWKSFLHEKFKVVSPHSYCFKLGSSFNLKKDLRPILIKDIGSGYFHQDLIALHQDLKQELKVTNISERDIFIHVNDLSNMRLILSGSLGQVLFYSLDKENVFNKNVSLDEVREIFEN